MSDDDDVVNPGRVLYSGTGMDGVRVREEEH